MGSGEGMEYGVGDSNCEGGRLRNKNGNLTFLRSYE
jgi:hypothetical protein